MEKFRAKKSEAAPSRVGAVASIFWLAKQLLFVPPERSKSLPDGRASQLIQRISDLVKENAATKPLTNRKGFMDTFLDGFESSTVRLDSGEPVIEKLSFYSTMHRTVVESLIKSINSSICSRPDIQSERDLLNLMYPITVSAPTEEPGARPYRILDNYEDFESSYALMGKNADHRQGILLPVASNNGEKIPGVYVEYSSSGLSRLNSAGSMPFHITFVVLPQSTRIAPPSS